MLALIESNLAAERRRPLSDLVRVLVPTEFSYEIRARLTLYGNVDADATMNNARLAATMFVDRQRSLLGQHIVPTQYIAALSVAGVYRVELLSPTTLTEVPQGGWSNCTLIEVELAGVVNA